MFTSSGLKFTIFRLSILALGLYTLIFNFNLSWMLWSLIISWPLGIFGVTIALHRYYAHRSFKTGFIRDKLLAFASLFSLLGSPIAWVIIHRQHHYQADKSLDPHSPHNSYLRSFSSIIKNQNYPTVIGRDLKSNKFQLWLHKYYILILLSVYTTVAVLFGWAVMCWILAVPAFWINFYAGCVNVLAHTQGYRNFDIPDQSRNNWFLAMITLGAEGWHNNHHANPEKLHYGHCWWEWDLCYHFIRLFLIQK